MATKENPTKKEKRVKRRAERQAERDAVTNSTHVEQDVLAEEVQILDEHREQRGAVVDELVAAYGIEDEEEIDVSRENLGVEAGQYLSEFIDFTDSQKQVFEKDLKSSLTDVGLMAPQISMKDKGGETLVYYNRYVDQIGLQFQIKLARINQDFQRELDALPAGASDRAIREKYDKKFADLIKIAEKIAENYDMTARSIIQVAGSQSGADDFIDAKGHWTELGEFNRNGLELLKQMSPPEGFIDSVYEASSRGEINIEDFSMERMADTCSKSGAIIQKIHEGTPLADSDYSTMINSIEAFFGHDFDLTSFGTLSDSLAAVEQTGMLTAVYALSPPQRYELGQHILDSFEPKIARDGIEFLVSIGVLDVGQGQDLLEKNISTLAMFTDEEVENIRNIRRELEEVREYAAKEAKSGHIGNLALAEFTASNGILYEVVFRFAALGVALPFVFNIKNPSGWGEIVTNPFWLGCVAVTGLTLDHITGGIGQGSTSQMIAGIGIQGESEEDANERYEWAEFNRLLGDHPETAAYLTDENPSVLEDIVSAASDSGDMSSYEFTFDGLIEAHLDNEMDRLEDENPGMENLEEIARQNLMERYEIGLSASLSGSGGDIMLDGYSRDKTEQVISAICDQLFRAKDVVTLEGAIDAFAESRVRRGLDT